MSPRSRRDFLVLAGVTGESAIAGCLDDAGQPRLIYVFAANELRGPVPIEVYRPG